MITIWKTPIVATVEQVLKDLKLQLYGAGLLKEIKNTGSDLMCTCPFHANGKEHNPSCGVLLQQKVTKDKTYEAGTVHCYTCGYTADLPQFVADLLGLSSPVEGFKWLVNQYNYQTEERELPDLDMYRGSTAKSSVLEESLVKQYTQNLLQSEEACRYLHKRRIANWVLEAYELGFDPEDKTVLFPVRGMDGKVIFYKGRSIAGKHFYNAKEVDKTSVVFGLWEILNGSFSWGTADQIEEVWITESEIDALSLISYMLLDYIRSGKIGLAVLDSAPFIIPKAVQEKGLDEKSYGGNSALMKAFCDKAVPLCKKVECTFLLINQLRENIGNPYKPFKIPCGTAIAHACSQILWFTKGSLLDEKYKEVSSGYANPSGNLVSVKVEKNKVTKNDRRLQTYTLNYSTGVDEIKDTLDLAIMLGIISQAGAWFKAILKDGKEQKMQGFNGVQEFYYNDLEELEYLRKQVYEAGMV